MARPVWFSLMGILGACFATPAGASGAAGCGVPYNDTASARQVKGRVARRGLCGDVYLASRPRTAHIREVSVVASVRRGCIRLEVALEGLAEGPRYVLKAEVADGQRTVREFASEPFQRDELS